MCRSSRTQRGGLKTAPSHGRAIALTWTPSTNVGHSLSHSPADMGASVASATRGGVLRGCGTERRRRMVGVGPGLLRLQTQRTLFPTEVFLLTDNNITDDDLRIRMQKLGAREFEIVALMMDEVRGHAALDYAEQRAENPVPYAIALFDNPDWQPKAAQRRIATNLVVDKTCAHCGGDRFVPVTDGPGLYEETYAPCRECNAETNTARWSVSGERLVTAPQ